MSAESEKLKMLIGFKNRLEKKISDLEVELQEMKMTSEIINSILIEKGFKRGNIKAIVSSPKEYETVKKVSISNLEPKAPVFHSKEPESVIPLKTKNGESLAIIYVNKQVLHVLLDETKKFDANTPPFGSFLVKRVFMKMKQKDEELAKSGMLPPDKMFAYDITTEGELIREIIIKNVDENRLKDLRSSIEWTLEKMYEKTKEPI